MRRLALALLLSSLAITRAAAGIDLSHCLDPSTKLDAGGDVSDKELVAARQACAQLQQSSLDSATRIRVDHAASNLNDELQHRSCGDLIQPANKAHLIPLRNGTIALGFVLTARAA
jgi:hypothetical protein